MSNFNEALQSVLRVRESRIGRRSTAFADVAKNYIFSYCATHLKVRIAASVMSWTFCFLLYRIYFYDAAFSLSVWVHG